jgi:hypothetical protein
MAKRTQPTLGPGGEPPPLRCLSEAAVAARWCLPRVGTATATAFGRAGGGGPGRQAGHPWQRRGWSGDALGGLLPRAARHATQRGAPMRRPRRRAGAAHAGHRPALEHVHMHMHMHTHTCTRTHAHAQMHMHVHVHIHMHMTCTCTCACACSCTGHQPALDLREHEASHRAHGLGGRATQPRRPRRAGDGGRQGGRRAAAVSRAAHDPLARGRGGRAYQLAAQPGGGA